MYNINVVKELIVKLPGGSEYKLKNDKYRKARGGNSKVLDIFCSKCSSRILIYQKDGQGVLLRCYIDRIAWFPQLSSIKYEINIKNLPNFFCSKCNSVIATPMFYEEENRLAYRMRRGSFSKIEYKYIVSH